jgi:hypothetical protein
MEEPVTAVEPSGQGRHAEAAPFVSLYVFAGQGEHAAAPRMLEK